VVCGGRTAVLRAYGGENLKSKQRGWARLYGTLASKEMRGRTYSLSGAVVRCTVVYGCCTVDPYRTDRERCFDSEKLLSLPCLFVRLPLLADSLCADKLAIYVRRSDGIVNKANQVRLTP
jgi:hypothetical protein